MKYLVIILTILLVTTAFIKAEVLTVPEQYPDIQSAIDRASDGDLVLVSEGRYYENIDFKGKRIIVASHFLIDRDTSLIEQTIIDGSDSKDPEQASVVRFTSGEDTFAVLYGFTITGGSGSLSEDGESRRGGGIYFDKSGGRISYNMIKGNVIETTSKGFGAGVSHGPSADASFIILEYNWIQDNTIEAGSFSGGAGISMYGYGRLFKNKIQNNRSYSGGGLSQGGGLYAWGGDSEATLKLTKNDFVNNQAISAARRYIGGYGGGAWIGAYSASVVSANRFQSNEVEAAKLSFGAGLYLQSMDATNKFCTNKIFLNFHSGRGSGKGGGVYISESSLCFVNNLVYYNRSTYGGGVYVYSVFSPYQENQDARLINNTIVSNAATHFGGGIYTNDTQPVVLNSIVWDNTAHEYPGIYSINGSPYVRYSDVQDGPDVLGNISLNPGFANGNFELSKASPCIGAGIDKILIEGRYYSCPDTGFDGNVRPSPEGTMPDMGALEHLLGATGISPLELSVPNLFELKQNYPNPFNPQTTIEFSIPHTGFVALKIYDAIGKEVATLVSDNLVAGNYTTSWDASDFASGVYYYKIEAGNFKQIKKLLLVK